MKKIPPPDDINLAIFLASQGVIENPEMDNTATEKESSERHAPLDGKPVYRSDLSRPNPVGHAGKGGGRGVLLGIAFCFIPVIGVFIGIPTIIAGIWVACTIPASLAGCWEVLCPSCQSKVYLPFSQEERGPVGCDCEICKCRMVFKNGEVFKPDTSPTVQVQAERKIQNGAISASADI